MPGTYLYGWHNGTSKWVKLICDTNGRLKIDPALILENPPTEDESKKAATSEWSFDHKADASAHHAKYTDLEARTACNLNGTLYWNCAGIQFDPLEGDVNDITKAVTGIITVNTDSVTFVLSVNLPDRAKITKVIVYGNEAAEAETWLFSRIKLSTGVRNSMASENINTEDIFVSYGTVNNSDYTYFINTSSLDTNDKIHGARITFTL